jgi:hypothetical protein
LKIVPAEHENNLGLIGLIIPDWCVSQLWDIKSPAMVCDEKGEEDQQDGYRAQ